MRLTLGRQVGKSSFFPSSLLPPPSPACQWMPAAACMCWRELTSSDAGVSWHETQKRNADPGSDDLACCRRWKRYNSQSACLNVCSFSIFMSVRLPLRLPVPLTISQSLCLGIWRSYNVYVRTCMYAICLYGCNRQRLQMVLKDSCMKRRHL